MTVRLEPELREALDQEAAKRGISRSELIRDALVRVVDQDVLEEAHDRQFLAAVLQRDTEDNERLRAALAEKLDERNPPRPPWLRELSPPTDSGLRDLAEEFGARLAQRRAATAG